MSGIALSKIVSCKTETHEPRTNWAGNLTYSTDDLYTPETVAELQELIKKYKKIRGLGTKHSFNIVVSAGIVLWDFFSKIITT